MDKYEVRVRCKNCGFRGKQLIPKGYKLRQARCGRCGVTALQKQRLGIWPIRKPR